MSSLDSAGDEIPLRGGRITTGVVRIGMTVRRPMGPHSDFVHRLLRHLKHQGLDAVPRVLGVDDRGREILTFLPGEVPPTPTGRDWSEAQIEAAALLSRRLHDAAASSSLTGDEQTVCHNDFHPMNTVFTGAMPSAIFDFDQAAPGPRMRDVAYAAWLWLFGASVEDRLAQQLILLQVFLDTYGVSADDRAHLGDRIVRRVKDERELHTRAGRGGALTWLNAEIAWLERRATEVHRYLATPT